MNKKMGIAIGIIAVILAIVIGIVMTGNDKVTRIRMAKLLTTKMSNLIRKHLMILTMKKK